MAESLRAEAARYRFATSRISCVRGSLVETGRGVERLPSGATQNAHRLRNCRIPRAQDRRLPVVRTSRSARRTRTRPVGGGDEPLPNARYEREMQAVFERSEQDRIDASGNTPQEQAAALEGWRDRVRKVAQDVDELSPPSEVADAHEDFVAAMRVSPPTSRR
jgi:hypothetical protein